MPELLVLACSFVRQLRCDFRCIAKAMQRKPCLAVTQNSSAIFQHSTHDKILGVLLVYAVRTIFYYDAKKSQLV